MIRLKEMLLGILVTVLAGCAGGRETPMEKVGRYEVFEVTLESGAKYGNPFTDAEVKARFVGPKGRAVEVTGFYYGANQWKVRFVPDRLGAWRYRARLKGRGRPVRASGSFRCVKSDRHGFVRISRKNPYRFEYDDGTPFYPIGQQTGRGVGETPGFDAPDHTQWVSTDRETFMKAFTGATNLMRSQLGTGTTAGLALDLMAGQKTPDRYNPENCEFLDESSRTLKRYGWAQIIVPFQDMSLWGGGAKTVFGSGYIRDTYKSLKSKQLPNVEWYLRYVVARWSAYTDIWEIFNEDCYAPNDFLAHLAKVIRDADPYDHPITTNYERPAEPWCEIICPHEYMGTHAKKIPGHLSKEFARFKSFGKPVLYTEFGNKGYLSNYDPVKWRLAVWTAFMNESGVLFWNMSGRRTVGNPKAKGNSNTYLGPESRRAFRVLNEFTRDLPVTMRPVMPGFTNRMGVEVWALADENTAVVYVHNPGDHAEEVDPPKTALWTGPGRFRVKWIDPATGKTVLERDAGSRHHVLWLDIPPLKIDLAARLERIKRAE